MASSTPSRPALDQLLRSRVLIGRRAGLIFSVLYTAMLAVGMLIVRSADGPSAYLEGIVARGASLALLVASIPFAFRVAKEEGNLRVDAGIVSLARLRGLDEDTVRRRATGAVLRVGMALPAFQTACLSALAVTLSLPDAALMTKRALSGVALTALTALSGAVLTSIALVLSDRAHRWGRFLFGSILFGPWILSALLPVDWLSLPGAFGELRDLVLDHLAG
jgi:hypothetical protein